MAIIQLSFKRLAIDKAAKSILAILVAGSVLTVFGLAGSRALINQLRYQNKVIAAKSAAVNQLKKNVQAVSELETAYQAFDNAPESLLGTPDKNSKIILDALPSKYDFPALTTSLEKLLDGYKIENITGTDDEVAQSTTPGSQVVEIPFAIGASANYQLIQKLINDFDRSIRPMHILTMELSGNDSDMKIDITAKTFYQAEKTLEITTKEIQ